MSAPNTQKELSIPNYDHGFHQKPWRRFLNVFRCETSVGTLPPHLFVNLENVDNLNLKIELDLNYNRRAPLAHSRLTSLCTNSVVNTNILPIIITLFKT